MAALSDYLENKIVDWLLRGQIFSPPTIVYVALATTVGSDVAGGTEVVAAGYARVPVSSTLLNWAGTQAAGSTLASTGTSGTTSNNAVIQFPLPSANWGTVVEVDVYDASTAGNLLFRSALTTPLAIPLGSLAPGFAVGTLTFQIDN